MYVKINYYLTTLYIKNFLINFNDKNKLLIRMHKNDYKWNQKERWLDKFPNIEYEPGEIPFFKQFS